jgi:hypothetical protein
MKSSYVRRTPEKVPATDTLNEAPTEPTRRTRVHAFYKPYQLQIGLVTRKVAADVVYLPGVLSRCSSGAVNIWLIDENFDTASSTAALLAAFFLHINKWQHGEWQRATIQ